MKILAIDTCGDYPSLALWQEDQVFCESYQGEARQTTILLPLLQKLLNAVHCQGQDLSALAVSHGPGAFTSLRVGAALAQALAYAWDKPLFSVSTLKILAFSAFQELAFKEKAPKKIVVLQDARLKAVYAGVYRLEKDGNLSALHPDALWQLHALPDFLRPAEPYLLTGSALLEYPEFFQKFFPEEQVLCQNLHLPPLAKALAQLAAAQKTQWQSPLAFQAQYLRNEVAQTP